MSSHPDTSRNTMPAVSLPRWSHRFVMPVLLSVLMTAVVSAISTLKAVGVRPDIVSLWLQAWFWSWIVAFPTLLLVLPLVRRWSAFLTEEPAAPAASPKRG
ncbi:MAG: DUF2798 domain-containing protein [Hyphomicrobiales bacterium]|nr:MAG: DUF2798 domain-containing protein [Hyphomicrobiales bacterium]